MPGIGTRHFAHLRSVRPAMSRENKGSHLADYARKAAATKRAIEGMGIADRR